MNNSLLKQYVRYQTMRALAAERLRATSGDERGEVGSWLVFAGLLAAAAVAIAAGVETWLGEKVNELP